MLKAGNSIINSIKRALRHDSDEDVRGKQLILSFHNRFRLRQFKQVLEDAAVRSFLEFDKCYLLADNYLIAMVLVYFLRSDLMTPYYDARHFFSALYLAHEMEEDLEKLKDFIVPWFPWPIRERRFAVLLEIKYLFWINMNYECLVSRADCEQTCMFILVLSTYASAAVLDPLYLYSYYDNLPTAAGLDTPRNFQVGNSYS